MYVDHGKLIQLYGGAIMCDEAVEAMRNVEKNGRNIYDQTKKIGFYLKIRASTTRPRETI